MIVSALRVTTARFRPALAARRLLADILTARF